MTEPIPGHYFKTSFSSQNNITHWPIHFAILGIPVSSHDFNNEENSVAESLPDYLNNNYRWVRKLSGYNTLSQDIAQYFAVNVGWNEACDLAHSLGLEAIYYVSDNTLSVTYADERRKPLVVDSFLRRFTVQNDKEQIR